MKLRNLIWAVPIVLLAILTIGGIADLAFPGQIPYCPGWKIRKPFEYKGEAPFSKTRIFRENGILKAEGWIKLGEDEQIKRCYGNWSVVHRNGKEQMIRLDISPPSNRWISVPLARIHLVTGRGESDIWFGDK